MFHYIYFVRRALTGLKLFPWQQSGGSHVGTGVGSSHDRDAALRNPGLKFDASLTKRFASFNDVGMVESPPFGQMIILNY